MIIKQLCQIAQGTALYPTAEVDALIEHKQVYFYSENVNKAAMLAPEYFSAVADESQGGNGTLNVGDIMFLYASDGILLVSVTDAIVGTVVANVAVA